MFKNALVYRIEEWLPPTQNEIASRLDGGRFTECMPTQPESIGWVEPRGEKHSALLESVAGQLILQLCTETKAVPGGVVKEQLDVRLRNAKTEMAAWRNYRYTIISGTPAEDFENFRAIMRAERMRTARMNLNF